MRAICTAALCCAATTGLAQTTYQVTLEGAAEHIHVARLTVDDGTYRLDWNETHFSDAFLSMRPFRCMDGDTTTLCRLPYPYENHHQIGSRDTTDLEYDLLFLWKPKGAYGIDFWNGIYFQIAPDNAPDGAGWTGVLHEMDMNILAVPPVAGDLRPITPSMLHAADPSDHWLPVLRIHPIAQ